MKRPYIIAEIGFNHGGDLNLAVEMIKAAARSGADAVKFQSFKATDLYLKSNELYEIVRKGELSEKDHETLKSTSEQEGVDFLSTPFSLEWVELLDKIGVKAYKVASMDLNNRLLLKAIGSKGKTVYISTGVGNLNEVIEAVSILKNNGAAEIFALHCISNYPTKPEDIHLGVMSEIREKTGCRVGFSDHSLGIAASLAAISLGAEVIEKHFTTSKELDGPDHRMSLDPDEMKSLVEGAKIITAGLDPLPSMEERPDKDNRSFMRRGIYAARDIKAGETILPNMLKFVRPEATPLEKLDSILNTKAVKNFHVDEPLIPGN